MGPRGQRLPRTASSSATVRARTTSRSRSTTSRASSSACRSGRLQDRWTSTCPRPGLEGGVPAARRTHGTVVQLAETARLPRPRGPARRGAAERRARAPAVVARPAAACRPDAGAAPGRAAHARRWPRRSGFFAGVLGGREVDEGEGWVELGWPGGGRVALEQRPGDAAVDRIEIEVGGIRRHRRARRRRHAPRRQPRLTCVSSRLRITQSPLRGGATPIRSTASRTARSASESCGLAGSDQAEPAGRDVARARPCARRRARAAPRSPAAPTRRRRPRPGRR